MCRRDPRILFVDLSCLQPNPQAYQYLEAKMETPANNKQTTDEENDNHEPQPYKRSQYWFDDGSIVLQVERTQFRVHTSMLARHSNIFKDMFAIPQPKELLEPLIESCSIVQLHDKAEDVEIILGLFYDNIKCAFPLFSETRKKPNYLYQIGLTKKTNQFP